MRFQQITQFEPKLRFFSGWDDQGRRIFFKDVRGRGRPGLYMGRGRGRPRTATFNFYRTSEDEDVQDKIWDGDEDVRGRQFSKILGRGRPGRGPGRGRGRPRTSNFRNCWDVRGRGRRGRRRPAEACIYNIGGV